MNFRSLALAAVLAVSAAASHAGGALTLPAAGDTDPNTVGATDIFVGSGLLNGAWSFTLDPVDGNATAWAVTGIAIDVSQIVSRYFGEVVPARWSAALVQNGVTLETLSGAGVAGTASYDFSFAQTVLGGQGATLVLDGFGTGQTADVGLVSVVATAVNDATLQPSVVPEPETWAMMLAGIGAMGFLARRRSNPGL